MRLAAVSAALALAACRSEAPPPAAPPPAPPPKAAPAPQVEPEVKAALDAWSPLAGKTGFTFAETSLVLGLLEKAPAPADPAIAAKLALARFQSLAQVLRTIPQGDDQSADHVAFLKAHESQLVYSEPAGQHLLNAEPVWVAATTFASTPQADELAWLAATTPQPGECEGYVPCYLVRLVTTAGEYLKRQPKGAHVEPALNRIRESLPAAGDEALAELDASDVQTSREYVKELADAVAKVTHADREKTAAALAAADQVLAGVKAKVAGQ